MLPVNEAPAATTPVERPEQIASNVLFLTAAHALIGLSGLAATMIITRYLGPVDYGNLYLAYAYLGLFGTLVEASLNLTITREASQNIARTGQLVSQGIMIQGAFALVAYGLAVIILPFLGFDAATSRLFRIVSLFLFLSPFTLFRLIFLVTQKIKLVALLDVISHLLKTILVLSVILFSLGYVEKILWMQFVAMILTVILYYFYSRRLLIDSISFRFDWHLARHLLLHAWPLLVASILFTFQIHLGRLIIGRLLTKEEVGFFAVVSSLATALSFVPTIYFTSVYPLLSRYHTAAPDQFRTLYKFSFKGLMAISFPISLLAGLTGERIVTLYAGTDYALATPLFTILIGALPLNFAGTVFYFVILSAGKQAILPKVSVARVTLYLTLLVLFLYTIGYLGIGLAAIIMYLFTFTLFGLLVSTRAYVQDWLLTMTRPLLATLALYLLWHLTRPSDLVIWLAGPLLYLIFLLVIGGINRQEIEIAKKLWHNWRYKAEI
jgi:O-antigen/teichoic acid export membrane protein